MCGHYKTSSNKYKPIVIKVLATATPEHPLGVRSFSPVGNNTTRDSTAALWPLRGCIATGFVFPWREIYV